MVSAYRRARESPIDLTMGLLAARGIHEPSDEEFIGAALEVESALNIRALRKALLGGS